MTFDLTEALLWLCSIPSPTGEEAEICGAISEWLRRHGVAESAIRRYGNSLYVQLGSAKPGPRIALVGHTDVVRTRHDGPPRIEADRLYGPGASDMKSGLALMLGVVAHAVETEANLTLIFYAGEEGPYVDNELELIVQSEPSLKELDFALVLEPTDNQLQLGCGGTLHAQVTFHGRSAHSARPWQGQNAIYRAIPALQRLSSLEPIARTVEGLEWITSFSVTTAAGGRAPNVIPDQFRINVNARYAPDQSAAEVEARLGELVGDDGAIEIVDCSPPAAPFRNHPWVKLLEASGAREIAPKFGWTDVARFSALGIPAVNFGPGTLHQAHQANEWTSIPALDYANSVLRRWLAHVAPTPTT